MKFKAYAKINITLDVVCKREDGYHELDMIMVPISLYDVLDIVISDADEIICGKESFPLDDTNTIYKAIQLMRNTYNIKERFKVIVEKNIPMQAGLAGGSADGATTLKGINCLCNLNASVEELAKLGKQIGADVPFCVINKVARVKGIGEKIETFSIDCPFEILLVKPKEGVSTKEAFKKIDFKHCIHPNVDEAQHYLENNKFDKLKDCIGNTLEQSAFNITPQIKEIKRILKDDYHLECILMSGSGSTIFALTTSILKLNKAYDELKDRYDFVYKCKVSQ